MAPGLKLPYTGIILVFIGLFFLTRTLGLQEQLPFIYSPESFLLICGGLLLLFYLLSGRKQGYLLGGLILLALGGTIIIPHHLTLPPLLDQALFFHLLSLAFFLVFLIHTRTFKSRSRRNWPFFPAVILFGTGVLIFLLDAEIIPADYLQRFDILWPLALIGVGLYLVLNYLGRRGS